MTERQPTPQTKYRCYKCGKHFDIDDVYSLITETRIEYWCYNCGSKKQMKLFFRHQQQYSPPQSINTNTQTNNMTDVPKKQQKQVDKSMKGIPNEIRAEVLKILNDAQ